MGKLSDKLEEIRACDGGMCGHCIEVLCEEIIPMAKSFEVALLAERERIEKEMKALRRKYVKYNWGLTALNVADEMLAVVAAAAIRKESDGTD